MKSDENKAIVDQNIRLVSYRINGAISDDDPVASSRIGCPRQVVNWLREEMGLLDSTTAASIASAVDESVETVRNDRAYASKTAMQHDYQEYTCCVRFPRENLPDSSQLRSPSEQGTTDGSMLLILRRSRHQSHHGTKKATKKIRLMGMDPAVSNMHLFRTLLATGLPELSLRVEQNDDIAALQCLANPACEQPASNLDESNLKSLSLHLEGMHVNHFDLLKSYLLAKHCSLEKLEIRLSLLQSPSSTRATKAIRRLSEGFAINRSLRFLRFHQPFPFSPQLSGNHLTTLLESLTRPNDCGGNISCLASGLEVLDLSHQFSSMPRDSAQHGAQHESKNRLVSMVGLFLERATRLKVLDLGGLSPHFPLQSWGSLTMKALSKHSSLERLNLLNVALSDKSIMELIWALGDEAGFQRQLRLKHLTIGYTKRCCEMTSRGVRILFENLLCMTRLKHICVEVVSFMTEDLQALAQCLQHAADKGGQQQSQAVTNYHYRNYGSLPNISLVERKTLQKTQSAWKSVFEALEINSTLQKLHIRWSHPTDHMPCKSIARALNQNRALKELQVDWPHAYQETFKDFLSILMSSMLLHGWFGLRRLSLPAVETPSKTIWKWCLQGLRKNRSLQALALGCRRSRSLLPFALLRHQKEIAEMPLEVHFWLRLNRYRAILEAARRHEGSRLSPSVICLRMAQDLMHETQSKEKQQTATGPLENASFLGIGHSVIFHLLVERHGQLDIFP